MDATTAAIRKAEDDPSVQNDIKRQRLDEHPPSAVPGGQMPSPAAAGARGAWNPPPLPTPSVSETRKGTLRFSRSQLIFITMMMMVTYLGLYSSGDPNDRLPRETRMEFEWANDRADWPSLDDDDLHGERKNHFTIGHTVRETEAIHPANGDGEQQKLRILWVRWWHCASSGS